MRPRCPGCPPAAPRSLPAGLPGSRILAATENAMRISRTCCVELRSRRLGVPCRLLLLRPQPPWGVLSAPSDSARRWRAGWSWPGTSVIRVEVSEIFRGPGRGGFRFVPTHARRPLTIWWRQLALKPVPLPASFNWGVQPAHPRGRLPDGRARVCVALPCSGLCPTWTWQSHPACIW